MSSSSSAFRKGGKLFIALLLVLSIALGTTPLVSAAAAATFTPTSGVIGTSVTVSGTGWTASEVIDSVTVGGATATKSLTVNGSGVLSGTITIPSLAGGAKTIVITGHSSGAQTFASAFTVKGSATFTPASGPVGTTVTASGAGWDASDTILSVTVGGSTAAKNLSVDSAGALSNTFTIPAGLTTGIKDVVITGTTSGARTFSSALTVTTPAGTFSPTRGPVGTTLTVTGTGFAASDTVASAKIGNTAGTLISGATVGSNGALNLTFKVGNASSTGAVTVTGTADNNARTISGGNFTVTTISVSLNGTTSGPVGTTIGTVTGSGFVPNETINHTSGVTINGVAAANTLSVDGSGNLTGTITVPQTTNGTYAVHIIGQYSGDQTGPNFTVTGTATFSPASGPTGATVTISNDTNWAASESITGVTVGAGNTSTSSSGLTVTAGVLSGTITIPAGATTGSIIVTGSVSGPRTLSGGNFTVTTPAVTMPSSSGNVGASLAFTAGAGWAYSEGISAVSLGGVSITPTVAFVINGSGNITAGTIVVPALTAGAKDLILTGAQSGARTFAGVYTVTVSAAVSPATGPVGTTLTVTGGGWSATDSIMAATVGGSTAAKSLSVNSNGTLSGTITVPAGLSGGSKPVVITGSVSGAVSANNYTVTTPLLALGASSGATGTVVTVDTNNSTGWAASEQINTVTVGGTVATKSLSVGGDGKLTGTITIPTITKGVKDIVVTGSASGTTTFTNKFTVNPAATFTPLTGPVGTTVTINGTGFGATETISPVKVNGTSATSLSLSVTGAGVLSGTFVIGSGTTTGTVVTTGTISGDTTLATFTVASFTAAFSPASGPVGTTVNVTGLGWAANDITAVKVGTASATSVSITVSSGALSGTFVVANNPGTGAKDVTITSTGSGDKVFSGAFNVVAAALAISPASGPVGTTITVDTANSAGWVASDTIAPTAVTVGTVTATHSLGVGVDGKLTGTITVPSGPTTATIVITGAQSGTQTFTSKFTTTTAALVIAPTSGAIGQAVTVTQVSNSTGWAPSDTSFTVQVGGVTATQSTPLASNTDGELGGVFVIPTLSTGLKNIVITGAKSGAQTFTNKFTVLAAATFGPAKGPTGTTVSALTGSGWGASENILSVTLGGAVATPSTLQIDPSGVLTGTITVPSGLTTGSKDVVITGASSGSQTFSGVFEVLSNAVTFGTTQGPVGTVATINSGAGFAASETISSVTVGGVAATAFALTVDSNGSFTGTKTITIPTLTGGAKDVIITGQKSHAHTYTGAFTVTPTATPTTATGAVGTVTAVTGTGWGASENITSVTVGNVAAAASSLQVDGTGGLSGNITVPHLTGGAKDIIITGSSTGAKTFSGGNGFTVTPATSFTPSSGTVGSTVTVSGTGWASTDVISTSTGATFVAGGTTQATNALNVGANGDLSGTITVPSIANGSYAIHVIGSVTTEQTATGTFTAATNTATLTPATGNVGASVVVNGVGWAASEPILAVTVGGATATQSIALSVNGSGVLSGTIIVPSLTQGNAPVVVTGSVSGAVSNAGNFIVTPSLVLGTASGPVGTVVTVTGTGWTASDTFSARTVGGAPITTSTLSVNGSGVLSGSITIPSVAGGAREVVLTGTNSLAVSGGNFTVTSYTATFTPASGPLGTTVTVSGAGWANSEVIQSVTVGGVVTSAAGVTPTTGTGGLSGTITIPAGLAAGAQDIVITAATSGGITFTGAFTVTAPTGTFTPASGPIGTTVTVSGTGWAAGDTISAAKVGVTAGNTLSFTVSPSGVLSGSFKVGSGSITGTVSLTGTADATAHNLTGTFTVAGATATFAPASGPVGTQVNIVSSANWYPLESITAAGVNSDNNVTDVTHLSVNASGVLSGYFIVPSGAATGTVRIQGGTTGLKTLTTYTVTTAPSAALGATSGTVGWVVAVMGNGWSPSEPVQSVTVGGVTATHSLVVGSDASITGSITVPASLLAAGGAKTVIITGATSGAVTVSNTFTVQPTATLSPSSGGVGTVVTASGSGWDPAETVSGVTVDNQAVVTLSLSISSGGALSGTMTIPASVGAGSVAMVITGSTSGSQTFASAFNAAAFTANFSPTSGAVGATITVTGAGWAPTETINSVTVGGTAAANTLVITAGALSGAITIPTLTAGAKDVVITGSTSGPKTFTNGLTITATANFSPTSGAVGSSITTTGGGWAASEVIASVTVGGTAAVNTLSVSSTGNLSGTITVPSISTGAKAIVITGTTSGAQSFASAFTVTVGAAAKLAVTTQPSSAAVGASLGTPVVTVQDANGNTVTTSTAAVTLAITSGTGTSGASLSGTVTVNAVAGVATFSGLSIDLAGNGYVLSATATGLTSASSGAFNVSAASPVTSIALAAGWNLISLPLIPTNSAIGTVLSGVSDSVISVWSYDAATAIWKNWAPALGGELTTMVDGKGYWIEMSGAATLTITGAELPAPPQMPPTYSVVAGWNLVGLKSTTSKTVGAYLTGTDYRFPIYEYSGGAYTSITSSGASLQPGRAYWVYFNANGIISP